jgi:hypothetical protein
LENNSSRQERTLKKKKKKKKVHEQIFEVDDETKIIPHVTCLNTKYAVAHPTIAGISSDAIDIYAFPGTFERTLEDHVVPLYDMAN